MPPTVKQKMSIEEINEWADFWRYEIGVNVIPAITKVKKPQAGIFWTEWKDAPISEEQHSQWKNTNMFKDGMAIITGKVWHNEEMKKYYLVCIDLDNRLAVDNFCPKGVDEYSSKTIVEMHSDDSSKMHLYFYSPTLVKTKGSDKTSPKQSLRIESNQIPAIEVKCGTLMFCSPSLHSGGYRYEILDCKKPKVSLQVEEMVEHVLSEYNIEYMKSSGDKAMVSMDELKDDNYKVYAGNNRHESMLRYVDSIILANKDMTDDMILQLALIKDEKMNVPPLGESDVNAIVIQCRKKTREWISNLKTIDIEGLPRGTTLDEKTDEQRQKKPSHEQWADKLQEEFQFRTFEETDEVLWYYEGVYIRGGEIQIKKRCEQIIQECTTNQVNEVINTIRRRTYVSIKKFDTDPTMINLRNCWVNINDGSISEHSSEKLSLVQLDVFYDPSRIPVKFNMFLRQCHASPKAVYQLWESFSSCLLKTAKFSKAFMHIGLGANGKSVYLKVINTFLGHENVSNMSIHTIENNRFAPAQLYGKLANIYADISSEELRHTGNFKNIVSGDNITAEKKGKDPFEFVAIAKMFFSANQIPKVFDESDGFFRRFIITEWDKQFSKSEQNPNLIQELTTDEEKSGILNILIAMAKELNRRGYFKYDVSTEHLRSQWKKKSDSVSAFNDECMVFDPMMMIDKTRYYEKYIEYCRINKIPPLTRKQDFISEVKNGTPLEDDGKPVRVDLTSDSWWYLGENSKEKSKLKRVWRGGMLKADLPAKNGSIERYSEGKPHA